MNRRTAIEFLMNNPYKFGNMVGFTKLNELHNKWICEMLKSNTDRTMQGHRGSYKTSCVSIALSVLCILRPNKKILFMRKTDNDIKEIIAQVKKILLDEHTQALVYTIYGTRLNFAVSNATELLTNLSTDVKGTPQLTGLGIGASLTGKHFDIIFTDDIVNLQDRVSKAERDRTKLVYQELQNIKNRGGRIFNTGTPWHKEDCFALMPQAEKYDVYSTGLLTDDEINEIKSRMTKSLFAANYELRHISSDDVLFDNPQIIDDVSKVEQGECQIDAAYGGEDFTAFTIGKKQGDKLYIFGKLWQKHIDDCIDEVISYRKMFNAGRIYLEDNGDKGYLAKELRNKGERCTTYHENMNKFLKITSYLKFEWKNVIFVTGTDKAYIEQICDYTENAEHDDAPDSLASLIRKLKKHNSDYVPLWN